MRTTSTKNFFDYPCAHRQWRDASHCKYVHGYSRSFHFEFGAHTVDDKGWVVPFGGLKEVRAFLDAHFDHTFLVAADDPELEVWKGLHKRNALDLVILPYGPSMEGTARFVFEQVDAIVDRITDGRCFLICLEARENGKNSAVYHREDQYE